MSLIPNCRVSVGRPPLPSSLGLVGEEWSSFLFHIHHFASLSTKKTSYCIESPEFSCNGHPRQLRVYPGVKTIAGVKYLSVYLCNRHRSEGESNTADFVIHIVDKFGNAKLSKTSKINVNTCIGQGWEDFIPRSEVLDKSKNILDSDGCLNIVVSMKENLTNTVFVPKHPLLNTIKGMFNDEATTDVRFEVSNYIEKEEKQKKSKTSVSFHAHRFILNICASMLADLLGDNDSVVINNIKSDIFHHLLYHIYGGEVSREDLKTHAKDIINAADKYAIINLKLIAEAVYVESTDITFDNAVDNLLYADSKNCALLKERVISFLADHPNEAAEKISFTEFPGHVVRDLLVVFGTNGKNDSSAAAVSGLNTKDELNKLSVSALRRKLHEKGLDVDGSREAMIESLKNSTAAASEDRDLQNSTVTASGDDAMSLFNRLIRNFPTD